MDQTIVQSIQGTEVTTDQTTGYGIRYQTVQVDADGNAWMDITYEWIYVKTSSAGVVMEYDSANPPAEATEMSDMYAAMIGKGYSIKVAPSGEVLEVQGIEEMMAEMWADMGADQATIDQMEQFLGDSFTDEGMKDLMGNTFLEFPLDQVAIGDTWFVSVSTSGLMAMMVDTTYTLLEYEDGLATIDESSIMYTNPESEPAELMGVQIIYDLSGTQEGTVVVDTETGWTVSANYTQAFDGEMRMVYGDEEMVVPISITSNITIELIPGR